MEYLDDALGPMFDFLTDSGLDQSTYLMFTADNGPAVYHDESPPLKKLVRGCRAVLLDAKFAACVVMAAIEHGSALSTLK